MAKKQSKATKQSKPAFTDAELKVIHSAAVAVWAYVGADYLELGGRSITRSEVIEVVSDAGRLEEEVERAGTRAAKAGRPLDVDTKELAKRLTSLTYEQMVEMLRPAFPYSRYGM